MDAETFKKVFLPHHQKLYRIAYRLMQNVAESEDVVQETFIKIWNKRNELKEIESAEAFSVVILRNICMDYLRKTKYEYQVSYDTEVAEKESLSHRIELQDEAAQVKSLINKLPEQQRMIMMMKHWDEYSDEEIEQITGINSGNIRVILSRARKTVREQFFKMEKQWISTK
jgi:RNA polymerase sigma-70 factor (ECF subfamily)